ncbi:hypothetical protein CN600_21405 [Bacillus mycoides]|nr:hypothetical protein CN600_21405 [Bacillus mycoides]
MAELLKVREITIDTMQYKDFATKEEELKVMRFYQNDLNSAKLLINVTHDKVVTDFSTATKVQVAFQKPDGKRVFQDVQNVNQMQGKYYVVLSTQTLIAYGNVVAQLRLTFPNNKVIETCKFVFAVDESIMSDAAMESTNEFPVIQKAIEAGKKLEGVDIDGIIAAGSKADAALPKAGGTMTGHLYTELAGGNDKRIAWTENGALLWGLTGAQGTLRLNDWKNSKLVWEYDAANYMFNMMSNTNLLKKAGDTMTGNLDFDRTGTTTRKISFKTGGVEQVNINQTGAGFYGMYDVAGAQSVWEYNQATKTFNVNTTNTNLVTKAKDGRATLTLTADAENVDGNIGPIADRRGNTVTVRMAVRRKTSNSATLLTLPTDMRPLLAIHQAITATDGTVARLNIAANGNVFIETMVTPPQNKDFYITVTYVVD